MSQEIFYQQRLDLKEVRLKMYDENYYFHNGKIESEFRIAGVLRPDQASAVVYAFLDDHRPKILLSIGCGIGILESFFETFGVRVIGTDPSETAKDHYQGKEFHQLNFIEAIKEFGRGCDTIVCCEVIEHIPPEEFQLGLSQLRQINARLIITNRLEYYPINLNNWDHINKIDDGVFDEISLLGCVRFRHGSHLVIDIGKH